MSSFWSDSSHSLARVVHVFRLSVQWRPHGDGIQSVRICVTFLVVSQWFGLRSHSGTEYQRTSFPSRSRTGKETTKLRLEFFGDSTGVFEMLGTVRIYAKPLRFRALYRESWEMIAFWAGSFVLWRQFPSCLEIIEHEQQSSQSINQIANLAWMDSLDSSIGWHRAQSRTSDWRESRSAHSPDRRVVQ